MIKYLFILVNAFTVFIYSLFGGDNGITVSGNIPKTMTAGQEVAIEIKVTKGTMSGFAKLQLDVPEGLSLKELENRGANFSYSDGVAKWVWASLPTESDITVKATLIASSSASGVKTIGAKYSFVENNAKQVVEMVPIEVTIGADGGSAVTTTTTQSTVVTPTETAANTNTTAAAPETNTTAANSNKEPAGNVTVVRTISKGSNDGEYIVNLKVKKGSTRGFARYSDDLPSGVTAKAISTDGSSFSVADGKVKFVWVSVLIKDELDLSYSLSSNTNVSMILKGEYSYLEDNQSKKFLLAPEPLAITLNQAATTTATEPVITPTVAVTTPTLAVVTPTETPAVVTPTQTQAVVTPTETVAVTTPTETPKTVVEPVVKTDGNVNYRVQIGAFTNANVTASALKQKFGISENVNTEMQGGFSKFMIGSHGEYKGARDQREVVRNNNGVKGAFVVAYNQSKRITVQEALMISNQKWYK
jgi:cell division septation protein DedD